MTSDLLDFTAIDKLDLEKEFLEPSEEGDEAIEYVDKMIKNISVKI